MAGHCSYIPNATSNSYEVQSSDAGSELVALVTASNANGSASVWSQATSAVTQPPPSGGGGLNGGGSSGGATDGGGTALAHTSQAPMLVRISDTHLHGRVLTVTVRVAPGSAHAVVSVSRHGRRISLSLTHRKNGVLTFVGKLPAGHWTVTVTCSPPAGYAAAAAVRRSVAIP